MDTQTLKNALASARPTQGFWISETSNSKARICGITQGSKKGGMLPVFSILMEILESDVYRPGELKVETFDLNLQPKFENNASPAERFANVLAAISNLALNSDEFAKFSGAVVDDFATKPIAGVALRGMIVGIKARHKPAGLGKNGQPTKAFTTRDFYHLEQTHEEIAATRADLDRRNVPVSL